MTGSLWILFSMSILVPVNRLVGKRCAIKEGVAMNVTYLSSGLILIRDELTLAISPSETMRRTKGLYN